MSFPDTFYTIDVLFFSVMALFGALGLFRGVVRELARLLSAVSLLLATGFFYSNASARVAAHWPSGSPAAIHWVVGLLFFVGALVLHGLFSFWNRELLGNLLQESLKAPANCLFGALVGVGWGALVGALTLCALSFIALDSVQVRLRDKSIVGHFICEHLAPQVHFYLFEKPAAYNPKLEIPAS